MNINKYLSFTAFGAGSILALMVAIGVWTGVSQQTFECYMVPAEYARGLRDGAGPLRLILGLDNIFIALYVSVVLLLVVILRNKQNLPLLVVVAAAGITGGLLDYLENHHILTMLVVAEGGGLPGAGEIQSQMISSMLKWHLSYFAFFLVAFAWKPAGAVGSMLRFALLYVQLPVGVMFYVLAGTELGEVLFYARYGNLLGGFFVIGYLFWGKSLGAAVKERHPDSLFA